MVICCFASILHLIILGHVRERRLLASIWKAGLKLKLCSADRSGTCISFKAQFWQGADFCAKFDSHIYPVLHSGHLRVEYLPTFCLVYQPTFFVYRLTRVNRGFICRAPFAALYRNIAVVAVNGSRDLPKHTFAIAGGAFGEFASTVHRLCPLAPHAVCNITKLAALYPSRLIWGTVGSMTAVTFHTSHWHMMTLSDWPGIWCCSGPRIPTSLDDHNYLTIYAKWVYCKTWRSETSWYMMSSWWLAGSAILMDLVRDMLAKKRGADSFWTKLIPIPSMLGIPAFIGQDFLYWDAWMSASIIVIVYWRITLICRIHLMADWISDIFVSWILFCESIQMLDTSRNLYQLQGLEQPYLNDEMNGISVGASFTVDMLWGVIILGIWQFVAPADALASAQIVASALIAGIWPYQFTMYCFCEEQAFLIPKSKMWDCIWLRFHRAMASDKYNLCQWAWYYCDVGDGVWSVPSAILSLAGVSPPLCAQVSCTIYSLSTLIFVLWSRLSSHLDAHDFQSMAVLGLTTASMRLLTCNSIRAQYKMLPWTVTPVEQVCSCQNAGTLRVSMLAVL